MADFSVHREAHRRLRAEAKARGCFVLCKPETAVLREGSERRDRYQLIDRDTGQLRGAFLSKPLRLTKEAVDEFFAKEFQ